MVNDQDGAVPPRGWERPPTDQRQPDGDALAQLAEQLLTMVPEDLRVRLTEALRQLLEAIRALIDWCVARLEHRASAPPEVRDIPIL
ncbi:MAG: hypothetical protein KGL15_07190 [Acidobacteriota bacterium]|nr:hypothetical protein [Acidobacteriota bacterium]